MVSRVDKDKIVLAVGLLEELNDRFFIVNGSGSNKEHHKLSDFDIDIESASALLGFHAFTGDFLQENCWKLMRNSQKFKGTIGK